MMKIPETFTGIIEINDGLKEGKTIYAGILGSLVNLLGVVVLSTVIILIRILRFLGKHTLNIG